MFEYFVRSHVCLSVSVDVAFYIKLGFGREGRGFESGSCFLGDVGLSLDLAFGGREFEYGSWFWGVGRVFFKIGFCLGGEGGFTLIY